MNKRKRLPKQVVNQRHSYKPKPRSLSRTSTLFAVLAFAAGAFWITNGWQRICLSMSSSSMRLGDLDNAFKWLEHADRFGSVPWKTELQHAKLNRMLGDSESMLNHLQSAAKLGAPKEDCEREFLLAQASTGDLSNVEDTLRQWLSSEPSSIAIEVIEAYANGLAAASRFEEAIQVIRAWQSDRPNDPRTNYRLGRIYEYREQFDQAESEYRQAIGKQSNYFPACNSLGRLLLFQKRPEDAMVLFERCLKSRKPLAAHVGIAECMRAMGNLDQSRSKYMEVLKQSQEQIQASYRYLDESPERFIPASELGRLETEAGNFEEAIKWLEIALQVFPLDSLARYSYAVALRGTNRKAEAEKQFEIVRKSRDALDQVVGLQDKLRQNPHDSETRIQLGSIILANESERTGLYWIRSVFVYDPNNSKAHCALKIYYEKRASLDPRYRSMAEQHERGCRED